MTDKERLEEIDKRAKHRVLENSRGEVRYRFTEINTEDFDWLIEQARIGINTSRDKQALIKSNIALNERVQELEQDVKEWEIVNESWEEINTQIVEQNKRYREAIERAIDKLTWNSVESEEILLEALEGEE